MKDSKHIQTSSDWWKPLLTSILGTAIGVGLTVAVNRNVDSHKQQSAQRETAIMAVCDIDEIVRGLKDEMHLEDSLFKVAMYVWSHQELIDQLSTDTLDRVLEYLYDDPTVMREWTADTKENAFNSGIDARMNLGNNQFYDNVQSCYYVRRSLMKVMADAPLFCRPVSKDVFENLLHQLKPTDIDYNGLPIPESRPWVLKQVFALESTTLYLKRYFPRRTTYGDAVEKLQRLNRENKLLMDITDEDVDTYRQKSSAPVSPQAIGDLILGTWELNLDNDLNTYVISEDHTFDHTYMMEIEVQVQLEDEQQEVFVLAPMTAHVKGRWELTGDTMTIDFDYKNAEVLSFDFDTSSYPQAFQENEKEAIEVQKKFMREGFQEQLRQVTLKEENVVSFDKSANTMVWTKEERTPAGHKQTTSLHLYRKPE